MTFTSKSFIKILYSLILFCLIFAFPIYSALNGARVAVLFVFCIYIFSPLKKNIIDVKNINIGIYFFLLAILLFLTLFQTIIFGEFDFFLVSSVITSILLSVVSYTFFYHAKKYFNIQQAIVYCFIVQSIILILCIVNEPFYNLTSLFRAEIRKHHFESYGRLRGSAISGYQFFGLSTMFGFVIIYLILHLNEFKYSLLTLFLLSTIGIIQGRYTVVAIGLGFFFLSIKLLKKRQGQKIIKVAILVFFAVTLMIISLFKIVDSIQEPRTQKIVKNYLLSPVESFLKTGKIKDGSTDILKKMYKSDEIKKYFSFGSGRYINKDGSYFGHVDIGYYRLLGYYGIAGTIFLFFILFYFIYFTNSKLDLITKHAFFLYFLLLNVKGDVYLYSNNVIPILVAFLFFSNNSSLCIEQKHSCLNIKKISRILLKFNYNGEKS